MDRLVCIVLGFVLLVVAPAAGCDGPKEQAMARIAKERGTDRVYAKINIKGERIVSGLADPTLEYGASANVGWMAYSSVKGPGKFGGPFVHTHLAKSTNQGRTWSYVKAINESKRGTLTLFNGKVIDGVWRYEVPTLAYDPDDAGKEWKLFTHKYFWNEQKDRMPAYGWISYRHASNPAGQWSEEVALFGAGKFPPAPYNKTRVDLNALHPELRDMVAYSEPGALYKDGVLYMSLTALQRGGPDCIVLVASSDHGKSWRYVNTLLTRQDAKQLGYTYPDASALVTESGRTFLMFSPGDRTIMHNGTVIVEFEDIRTGTLHREPMGKCEVHKHVLPQARILSQRGAGQADYHEHNKNGGIVMMQLNIPAFPETWQLFSTRESVLKPSSQR